MRGVTVQRQHAGDRCSGVVCGVIARARRREHDACAKRLREHECIARQRAGLPEHARRMHGSSHGQPVLRLGIVQRVAAGDDAARLGHLLRAAEQDAREDRRIEVFGKPDDVEREQHLAAHRVHIAHRVRCGDGAKQVRIVDDGRKEIHRLDDRKIVGEAIHGGIIRPGKSDDQIGKLRGVERVSDWAQNLRERADARFTGSTGAGSQARQTNILSRHSASPPFAAAAGGQCRADSMKTRVTDGKWVVREGSR